MSIVGGLDLHRKQITFDVLDTDTGQLLRGRIAPANRELFRGWLAQFAGREADLAVEGCTGWRFVVEECQATGVRAHLAEPADVAGLKGRRQHAKTDLLTEPLGITAAQNLDRHRGLGRIGDLRALAVADRCIDLESVMTGTGHSA